MLGTNYDFLASLLKDNIADGETKDDEQKKSNRDKNESEEEIDDSENTMNIFVNLMPDQYLWEKQ